jgi:hypothetical protein
MSSFRDLRIVDNFYQTSAFFPMPTVLVSTLSESGQTSIGSYSLCFPYMWRARITTPWCWKAETAAIPHKIF